MATIAGRFQAALAAVDEPDLAGPELLPVRLARACGAMLPVDGVGISILDVAQQLRIPLGASNDDAERAERLQFTVGSGPCMEVHTSRQPIFAVSEDLHRRWPAFTELLLSATPFTAVVALPLQPALAGSGAIDLYFREGERVPDLDVFEAMAVGELVTSALSDAAVWSTWSPTEGPEWLHGPAPRRRAAVWAAMGKVSVDLAIGAPAALELMRAAAHGSGRSVEDVAAELISGEQASGDLPRDPDAS